jgi:enterochelin esterase-like enzyme
MPIADAGQPAQRELSIYVPEGYETSALAYPVLYLIHGYSLDNRLWIKYAPNFAPLDRIDELVETGEVAPLIIVMPDMGPVNRNVKSVEDHFIQEIMPFVEEHYRTIAVREGRAIGGYSLGGADAFHIALSYPDLFSIAVGYSSGGRSFPWMRGMLEAHSQELFPLRFWVSCGRSDSLVSASRNFAEMLEELGLPYVYFENAGGHEDPVEFEERIVESVYFLSEILPGSVTSVELLDETFTTWGYIKTQH